MLTARPGQRAGESAAGDRELPAFEAVAAALAQQGVDTVFGVLGSGNFRLVERLTSRPGVSFHWARQETAAVTMADAWSRVTGRVGVCALHQGPGLTNAMTGLAEAAKSRTPLLVIVGEVATTAVAANQRIDQDRLARAAGAQPERVARGHSAVRDALRAWRRAQAERAPVVLSFPVDVQDELSPAPASDVAAEPPAPATPGPSAIARVVELIGQSHRPLILGGRGAALTGAGQLLLELAERAGALLTTSAPAHGLFSGSPWSLGISGGFASPLAQRLIPQADLVLAFGASLTHWTTRRGELIGAQVALVQFDVDPGALRRNRPDAIPVHGDAGAAAAALNAELERRGHRAAGRRWELDPETLRDPGWPAPGPAASGTVDPRALLTRLDAKLPAQRGLTTDAGHFQGYPPMHMQVPDGRSFVMTQSFQSVGLGLASGLGAAVARPDRITVAVVGDGGMMMSLGELDSAAAQRLSVLIVVIDDGAYGAEVHHFGPMGESTALVEFGQRDFAAVARALSIPAQTVTSLDDLETPALDLWVSRPEGPFLLDCKVDPQIRAEWLQEAFRGGG